MDFGMFLILFACGCLFLFLGIGFKRSTAPTNFWANGKRLTQENVEDVAAYNAAHGTLWMKYSLWYFAAGVLALLGFWQKWAEYAALALLFLSVLPGMILLIRNYKRIEIEYVKKS